MSLCVIATKIDNTVWVGHPFQDAIITLREGNGISCVAHSPHNGAFRVGLKAWLAENAHPGFITLTEHTGFLPLPVARQWEITKLVRDAQWRPDREDREAFAAKWIDSLIRGGLAERDAVQLIGEYAAPAHYTSLEIVDRREIPLDFTHRDAWRRSHNGGPIWIDETLAQQIDEARMWSAYQA